MAFAQLTFRESLRDIEACLRAHEDRLYHMGIRDGVSRNALAITCDSTDSGGNRVAVRNLGGTILPSELENARNCGGAFTIGSC